MKYQLRLKDAKDHAIDLSASIVLAELNTTVKIVALINALLLSKLKQFLILTSNSNVPIAQIFAKRYWKRKNSFKFTVKNVNSYLRQEENKYSIRNISFANMDINSKLSLRKFLTSWIIAILAFIELS